ncbi:cell envelope integrity protein TolA [Thiohalorhabdus sp.]|uniref:cell envelope integrity protein TolA n=1 Tax=Thiohalorhabdus sp. TaxID=3094134 RepID=UPI002FC381D0
MNRLWLQGLTFSVLVHVLMLSAGLVWTLLSHTEPPEPQPMEARLVAPESKAEAPAQPESPEPADAATEREADPGESAPKPRPEAQAVPEPDSAPDKTPGPAIKTPEQAVLKKRLAKREPEKKEPAPEPEETAPEPEEPEREKPEEGEPGPAKNSAPEKPSEPEPILSEELSNRIAEVADQGDAKRGSLRQRQAVARFQEAVRSRVQSNWLLPPGLEDRGELSARVRIALTTGGELAAPPEVVASNGPGYFNSSVVRAVEKAAPFPMPDGPTQYFQELELHFSPDMVQ